MLTVNRTINLGGYTFYIGRDVHRRKWVITICNNQIELKTAAMYSMLIIDVGN
jgi:hypothetical protein